MKVAISFSSKDRTHFTKQTLPRVLDEAEGNFDLFWLDGSDTKEGIQFPYDFAYQWRRDHDGKYPLKYFPNVKGGPAAAIQTAWRYMYDNGYDYIGLIENDVLLEPGWFKKTMSLFEKDGNIGIASARCFTDRILSRCQGYADMANVGAGMCIMKRDLVIKQLENWQQPTLWVLQILCKHFTQHDYPIPPKVLQDDHELKMTWMLSHDWWWEFVGWKNGYLTHALLPSMAKNLDDPNGERDRMEK